LEIYTVLQQCCHPSYVKSKALHEEMHAAYTDKDFELTIHLCKLLKVSFYGQMEDYYDIWIKRCKYMLTQDLPEDWDGIFRATTK